MIKTFKEMLEEIIDEVIEEAIEEATEEKRKQEYSTLSSIFECKNTVKTSKTPPESIFSEEVTKYAKEEEKREFKLMNEFHVVIKRTAEETQMDEYEVFDKMMEHCKGSMITVAELCNDKQRMDTGCNICIAQGMDLILGCSKIIK